MAKILNDRFVLMNDDKPVASGGMADIYKAFDLHGSQEVAIKLFKGDFATDKISKEAYSREQKSLLDLNVHENIVDIVDSGLDESTGRRYIVLEWMDNDLKGYLKNNPVKKWDEFQEHYGNAVLDALKFAFGRDILHRDISPSNILVNKDGVVKIADFGISKFKNQLGNLTLAEFKTAPYAPLEDSFDYPDVRDVFSYVVTALECIFGNDFEDYHHVRRFLENDLVCDEHVRRILDSAISLEPEVRPFNIIELSDQLSEAEKLNISNDEKYRKIGIVITKKAVDKINEYRLNKNDSIARNFIIDDLNEGISFKQHEKINIENDVVNNTYNIITSDFSYLIRRDSDHPGYFVILQCKKLTPVSYDIMRRDAVEYSCEFVLSERVQENKSSESIDKLLIKYSDDINRIERERINKKRDFLLNKWRDAIDIRKDIEFCKESPIYYNKLSIDGKRIIIQPDDDFNIESDLIGQSRIIKQADLVSVSGEIEWIDQGGITLYCEKDFDPEAIPLSGSLVLDTKRSKIALNRQKDALDALQNLKSTRADLRRLLLDPSLQTEPLKNEVEFIQKDLDDSKKNAVKSAMGAKDILVVEGPPGTGKTKFIVELVLQSILKGETILLTSQTHIALDNALQRIQDEVLVNNIEAQIVRIGQKDDKRVAKSSKKLLLEYGVSQWVKKVKELSESGLKKWSIDHDINIEQVRIGMGFFKLRSLTGLCQDLDNIIINLNESKDSLNSEIDVLRRDTSVKGSVPELRETLDETMLLLNEKRAARKISEKERDDVYKDLEKFKDIGKEIYKIAIEDLDDYSKLYMGDGGNEEKCKAIIELIEDWHSRLERQREFQAAYLASAQLVAGTCVGVAASHLQKMEFDLCIVDEASKAMPTEIIVPMVRSKKWIIVGDTKQLPPYVGDFIENRDICERYNFSKEDYRRTLLEHLVENLPEHSKKTLKEQYRMVKPIGDLVSHCFYDSSLISLKEFTEDIFIRANAVPKPVTWFSTSAYENRRETKSKGSYKNFSEVEEIKKLLSRLQFAANTINKKFEVVIMSGYSGQVDAIKRSILSVESEWEYLSIECCTVDTYQGREADIAIYSITRSNSKGSIGFLKEKERINVALSRGKELLCIIGDSLFCKTLDCDNPFDDVLSYIDKSQDCAFKGEPE